MENHPRYVSRDLQLFISSVIGNDREIVEERKKLLANASDQIMKTLRADRSADLIFICTHNSRRSHFAQVWAQVASFHYGLPMHCYSGGTEMTAVYTKTIDALIECGLTCTTLCDSANPIFSLKYSEYSLPLIAFSKEFDHPYNPKYGFGAVMTCNNAEENCPFIPEAVFRIPITYEDPKHSDNGPHAKETYMRSSTEIAQEMFYLMKLIAHE